MNDMVPSSTLSKYGVAAVGGIAGGVGLWVLSLLSHIPVIGLVAGGLVALVGVGAMSSHAPEDKRAGFVTAAAGGLTVLSNIGLFAGMASSLMGVAIFGLLGMGGWNAFKFMKGLKTRA